MISIILLLALPLQRSVQKHLWERETTGERKGNTQLSFMNPGLPNHANGIERNNLDFKEEGEGNNASFLVHDRLRRL